jgi:hypothetical protein
VNLSADDIQRIKDRDTIASLKLMPCPICPRVTGERVPTIYRARHTKKWMMRPGYFGCHHVGLSIFLKPADTAQQLESGWNYWVEENTPKP